MLLPLRFPSKRLSLSSRGYAYVFHIIEGPRAITASETCMNGTNTLGISKTVKRHSFVERREETRIFLSYRWWYLTIPFCLTFTSLETCTGKYLWRSVDVPSSPHILFILWQKYSGLEILQPLSSSILQEESGSRSTVDAAHLQFNENSHWTQPFVTSMAAAVTQRKPSTGGNVRYRGCCKAYTISNSLLHDT
ncbi:hypothetical protein K474DRAFT_1234455 [Panus rudis PR-1116 ss-1]|nr:hypothetical protein K474DRAFT_1234455 [Panus rudis PR-1116 ss-1]